MKPFVVVLEARPTLIGRSTATKPLAGAAGPCDMQTRRWAQSTTSLLQADACATEALSRFEEHARRVRMASRSLDLMEGACHAREENTAILWAPRPVLNAQQTLTQTRVQVDAAAAQATRETVCSIAPHVSSARLE